MSKTTTKRAERLPYSEVARRAGIIVRERGYRSIYSGCSAVGVSWMTVYRSLRDGLSPKATKPVLEALDALGILDLARNGR